MKILHITAHMGGGVGNILSKISQFDTDNLHAILCLEETKNPHFYKESLDAGVPIFQCSDLDNGNLLDTYDLVQVEWWHHPRTMEFLLHVLGKRELRLILWSHISGCGYPHFPPSLLRAVNGVAFTSPYSLENGWFSERDRVYARENCPVIPSVANRFENILPRKEHHGFRVGYVGFLGYNKLHPNFIEYCKSAYSIPDVHFTIVGDLNYNLELRQQISELPESGLYELKGYTENVYSELCKMDVFGYPLNSDHTGTTENALLEAMAAGVVPVAMNQGCERHIIQHGKTGFLVNSVAEYGEALHYLYENPQKRIQMGECAAHSIKTRFHLSSTLKLWNEYYQKVGQTKKMKHEQQLLQVFGSTPYDWVTACYDPCADRSEELLLGASKGSFQQYNAYFPDDERLKQLLAERKSHGGCTLQL